MYIRTANLNDVAAIEHLLGRAYPILMAASYDADILAAALPVMTRANPELLASGTFYVAEESGRIVGCGGWTFKQPGSGWVCPSAPFRDRPGYGPPRHWPFDLRAVRRDGRATRCDGFQAFAGLNAEPFYQSLGLRRRDLADIPLGPTAKLQAVLMEGPIPRT